MNIFNRIGAWLKDIFSANTSHRLDQHPDQVKREVLGEFHKHLSEVKQALVHLVYERKNLEQALRETKGKKVMLEEDLNNCLYENRDEVAAEVLAQLDQAKEEEKFYLSQLDTIRIEIEKAKDADQELQKQSQQARHQLNFLIGKQKILSVRKKLLRRLESTTAMVERKWPLLDQINDRVRHLEAETEVHEVNNPKWKQEINEMRSKRQRAQYVSRVKQLKSQLHGRTLKASGTEIIIPEVIKTH